MEFHFVNVAICIDILTNCWAIQMSITLFLFFHFFLYKYVYTLRVKGTTANIHNKQIIKAHDILNTNILSKFIIGKSIWKLTVRIINKTDSPHEFYPSFSMPLFGAFLRLMQMWINACSVNICWQKWLGILYDQYNLTRRQAWSIRHSQRLRFIYSSMTSNIM